MNGEDPVAEEVLGALDRGDTAGIDIVKKTWSDGTESVLVAVVRRKSDGRWFQRRSITLYADEYRAVAEALLEAAS